MLTSGSTQVCGWCNVAWGLWDFLSKVGKIAHDGLGSCHGGGPQHSMKTTGAKTVNNCEQFDVVLPVFVSHWNHIGAAVQMEERTLKPRPFTRIMGGLTFLGNAVVWRWKGNWCWFILWVSIAILKLFNDLVECVKGEVTLILSETRSISFTSYCSPPSKISCMMSGGSPSVIRKNCRELRMESCIRP